MKTFFFDDIFFRYFQLAPFCCVSVAIFCILKSILEIQNGQNSLSSKENSFIRRINTSPLTIVQYAWYGHGNRFANILPLFRENISIDDLLHPFFENFGAVNTLSRIVGLLANVRYLTVSLSIFEVSF
ncbi:hypothetical protein CEXT_310121 [Caerostris extrusa]|uniref:Uncharacterized protein n=1 Tax=Caerostris extrusa TaxID=172846 RepID=A0AAV4TJ91_CAEEX|nr:hypothetical protein CEXT_310121 [Caerostris extrusa]